MKTKGFNIQSDVYEICRNHRFRIQNLEDLNHNTLIHTKSFNFSLVEKRGKIQFYVIPDVLADLQKVFNWGKEVDLICEATNGQGKPTVSMCFKIYDIKDHICLDYTKTEILLYELWFKIKYVAFN